MTNNPGSFPSNSQTNPDNSQIYSEIFDEFIMELGQTALYFLGQLPDPDSGQFINNLPGAKHIVDQLEMIQFKTGGNLSPEESTLLTATLDKLRNLVGEEFQGIQSP